MTKVPLDTPRRHDAYDGFAHDYYIRKGKRGGGKSPINKNTEHNRTPTPVGDSSDDFIVIAFKIFSIPLKNKKQKNLYQKIITIIVTYAVTVFYISSHLYVCVRLSFFFFII